MKSLAKYLLYGFILLIIISMIASFVNPFSKKADTISLSELANRINSSQVADISVKGNDLDVTYADGGKAVAKKEPTSSLGETLLSMGVEKSQLQKVNIEIQEEEGALFFLGSLLPILLPFIFFILIFWLMFRQARQGSMQAFSFGKSKARLANETNEGRKKTTFKDVAGLHEAKEEIEEIVEFLRDPKKFHALGARIPRGVLLIGPPGTGKTLLAKASANEASVPFYYVSGAEFVEMFVGVGASRVSNTFEIAKKTAPSIIFIDEIDAVGRHRGAGLGGGHDEREQTLNQILVEMDGFDTNDAVIVMAATNRPDILDPALLRPGRFDRRITLDEPSMNDRFDILQIHAQGKPLAKDVDLRKVAERTPGFSGADLSNLVNEGAILAARKNQKEISHENLLQAIEKVILGPERRSHVYSKKEKEITAFHEAGHALVAASLPHSDPVHKVSIIARGKAGGYTLKLPTEDKHLRSRSEFESELAVLMGGYAAESLTFKEITTGASNDLKVASDLARRMVTQFGMSEALGPVAFGEREETVFLGKELATHKNYSETVAFEIDKEIRKLITNALKSAKTVLTKKMNTLNKIARELVKKETLEQQEFYALLKA